MHQPIMKIRLATPDDSQAIASLHTASWRLTYKDTLKPDYLKFIAPKERHETWAQRFASPKENQYVLVAELGSELIGFSCAYLSEHAKWGSYLDNLHVSKPYQGQGIGKNLLLEMARQCKVRFPGQGLYLLVNQDNLGAQQFYLRLGARNAQSGVWNAPDGSAVPTHYLRWDNLDAMVENYAND